MLVLTRKIGERIKIGHDITVQVLALSGNRVRIGIEAPPEVVILREELNHQELALSGQPEKDMWL